MNKENKNAAGLRRSAIAERIRLREEWSVLKGPESQRVSVNQRTNILVKKQTNATPASSAAMSNVNKYKESKRNMHLTNDTLRGVVALVEVGTECRALPLRAALSALGASVLPSWNPLVTHLIWSQGGCRSTRAKARALACRLVSPLWVEACAAASKRLPEQSFPAAARASDLPSPRTLRQLLKKAEMENIPIVDLLTDSNEENRKLRLRISSDTERDTSADITTDTSRDTSKDTSRDTSGDTTNDTSTGVESRVNTAPRRALPKVSSESPVRPAKSRRKLFTHREAEITRENEDSDESTSAVPKAKKPSFITKPTNPIVNQPTLTTRRRELARAERLAKKLIGCTPAVTQSNTQRGLRPRIVLTGMSRSERREITDAIKTLGGRIQRAVDRHTTHVLLGSCIRDEDNNRTGLTAGADNVSRCSPPRPRTLAALCGAVRGARVLAAAWARRSAGGAVWLHHNGYEVPHLKKISQKARVERAALGKQRSEYAYDVFSGVRVRIARHAARRDAARALLRLCGAVVHDEENNGVQNDGLTQNGDATQRDGLPQRGGLTQKKNTQHAENTHIRNTQYDIKIGSANGEISSKWVFDSVASGRMRSTRRYVNYSSADIELVAQMERFQC